MNRSMTKLLTAALVMGVLALMAASPASASPPVPLSPNPSSSLNELQGVSAVSPTDAWAVGYYRNDTTGITDSLILHWDGTTWSQVTSPNPNPRGNGLFSVSAVSSTDAWAVGRGIIVHWDGSAWSHVSANVPHLHPKFLEGVSADSPTDAWAVGFFLHPDTPSFYKTLTLHWDGSAWSRVRSPDPGLYDNFLYGVSALSPSDAWAVGQYHSRTGLHALTLHWDGTAWSRVNSPPGPSSQPRLLGVSALSSGDAWAAGDFCASGCGTPSNVFDTLILDWDGTKWVKLTSPDPSSRENALHGVNALSPADAWAVGFSQNASGNEETLIQRWNGSSWSMVASPNGSTLDNFLYSVSADSSTDAWSVGYYDACPSSGCAEETLILHWDGTKWVKV